MQSFLSNLAHRQTDIQINEHGQTYTSSFVAGKSDGKYWPVGYNLFEMISQHLSTDINAENKKKSYSMQ